MRVAYSLLAASFGVFLTGSASAEKILGPPIGPLPPEDDNPITSTMDIQQRLLDNCMEKPSCRESLLSDDSYSRRIIPEYDEQTAASGWADIRGQRGPGG